MKKPIKKTKYLNLKKKVYYGGVALITLMCASSISYAMEHTEDELVGNKFFIKNIKIGKYMFISDKVKEGGGNKAVLGGEKEEADIFIFEKDDEGYRIRKDGTNQYLLSSTSLQYWYGNRYIGAQNTPNTSSQFFKIYEKDQGYVIKNKKYHQYLYFEETFKVDGRPITLTSNEIFDKTFFILERASFEERTSSEKINSKADVLSGASEIRLSSRVQGFLKDLEDSPKLSFERPSHFSTSGSFGNKIEHKEEISISLSSAGKVSPALKFLSEGPEKMAELIEDQKGFIERGPSFFKNIKIIYNVASNYQYELKKTAKIREILNNNDHYHMGYDDPEVFSDKDILEEFYACSEDSEVKQSFVEWEATRPTNSSSKHLSKTILDSFSGNPPAELPLVAWDIFNKGKGISLKSEKNNTDKNMQ